MGRFGEGVNNNKEMKMKNTLCLFILISGFGSVLYAQVPEEVSPEVYKVLLDNEDVKVLEVTFQPGQSDELHRHNVMTFYAIQGGKMQVTLPDGTVKENEIPTGRTGHRKTITTHQVKNMGENTVKVIVVDHKRIKPIQN